MKIGIIDDDTQFSQVIKHKIEENTCFSKSSIDVFNNDFKSLQLKDYDYLFIDILLMQDNGITIAKSIDNKNTRIIFMSSNETLVYDCFDIALYFFIRKHNKNLIIRWNTVSISIFKKTNTSIYYLFTTKEWALIRKFS